MKPGPFLSRFWFLIPAFLAPAAVSLALAAFPVSAEEAAANLEKSLRNVRTFEARFEQLYYSTSVSTPLDEHGDFYFERPDRMRWEYREPQKKVFLYRDGILQVYLADENQLTRSRIPPEAYEADIMGIFLGKKSFHETYLIEETRFPTDAAGAKQIKLTPREEGDYSHILLEVDQKTWLLRRVLFFEWAGNKREFIFSRAKVNGPLPPRIFELKAPPGCEIIDEQGVIKR